MNMKACKTRFAPSPTGFMHVGNLRVALFNYLYAKRYSGTFLLRIEDTDAERSEAHFTESISEDLKWLGLLWQEGPLYQSTRQEIYDEYYKTLEQGGHVYPCFCTDVQLAINRKVQLSSGQPPRYPGTCRNLTEKEIAAKKAQGLPFTLRFHIPKGGHIEFEDLIKGPQRFLNDHIGDFIIRRGDGTAPFMYCNAIDDALMGVTHALRGDDHLTNTPRQILILQTLGLPIPQYGHFPTILGPDGRRLSKRNGSRSIQELRQEGYHPLAIINYLARLGHTDEKMTFDDLNTLASRFEVSRISRSPAHYDVQQLNFWQKEAINHCSWQECWNFISKEVDQWVPESQQQAFVEMIQPNIVLPTEASHWAKVIYTDPLNFADESIHILQEAGIPFFEDAITILNAESETISLQTFTQALQSKTGRKGKALFMPLRVALIGESKGPELAKIWDLLGIEKVRSRLLEAKQYVANL